MAHSGRGKASDDMTAPDTAHTPQGLTLGSGRRNRKNWKRRRTVALMMTTALLLAACGPGDADDSPESEERGDLRIAWDAQPPTLDPLMTATNTTRDITRNFYEPLITLDSNGEVQPVLAEEFEISDDASVVTFHLRSDVTFHDGSSFGTEDAVASLERWIELTINGQQFFSGAVVDSPEDGVVTLTLEEPMLIAPTLLAEQLQSMHVMPVEVIEAATDTDGVQEHIGTGPYKLGEWENDQYIRLDRFDDYVSPEGETSGTAGTKDPYFDSIYYEFVDDVSTRMTGLQTGEYDAAVSIPWDSAPDLENDDSVTVVATESGISYPVFNKAEGQMADINMRQAFMAAIDTEELLLASYTSEDYYTNDGALVPEGSPWYVPVENDLRDEADVEEAEERLAAAGYQGEPIRILASRDYIQYYNQAIVLQQQLEAAGMNVELIVTDWPTLVETIEDPEAYEMWITGATWRATPVTYGFLDPGSPGWIDSEEIAAAIDDFVYAADEADAVAAAEDLTHHVYDYLPALPIGAQTTITAVSNDYEGFEFAPFSGGIFYNMRPSS